MGQVISTCSRRALTKLRTMRRNHRNFQRGGLLPIIDFSEEEIDLDIHNRTKEQTAFLARWGSISSVSEISNWARNFAPFADTMDEAVTPLVNLICYCFDWPYAELWKRAPEDESPNGMTLDNYYVRNTPISDQWSSSFERSLRHLGNATKTKGVMPMVHELAGMSFGNKLAMWASRNVSRFSDDERKALLHPAHFNTTFSVPIVQNDVATHVLSFYSRANYESRDEETIEITAMVAHLIGKYHGLMEAWSELGSEDLPAALAGSPDVASEISTCSL